MGSGRKLLRTGLLSMKLIYISLTLLVLTCPYIFAQNTETGSAVYAAISPEILTVGVPFTITLIVDYPIPENVSVITPPFTGPLSLDRFLRIPRSHQAENENSHLAQTLVEFRLIPNTGGRIVVNSFSVITPQGVTETGPLILNIQGESAERLLVTLRFYWDGIPDQITVGERVTFTLRLNRNDSGNIHSQLPPPPFFMPEVPQGVILSQSSVSAQERNDGVVLKLTLIPLAPGSFNLPARILHHEEIRFEIPSLRISVTSKAQ